MAPYRYPRFDPKIPRNFGLAFSLFKYYQRSALDEPEVIQRWRELCSDPDEFSEVKNSWLFAGG